MNENNNSKESPIKEILEDPQIRYGSAMDHILEGCQIIGHDFRYLYVNDAVVKQGKSTKAKLLGHTMMENYPGIEKTEMFKKIKDTIENKNVNLMENEFTFPNGSVGWFELRMEPLPEGCIILSLDITVRKLREIEKTKQDKQKDTFIKYVTQKLPLFINKINHSLNSLLKDRALNANQKNKIKKIYSDSSKLAKEIDNFFNK